MVIQKEYPDLAAEENVQTVLDQIDSAFAKKLLNLGDFYQRTHEPRGAVYEYRFLVQTYPNFPEAEIAREHLLAIPPDQTTEPPPPLARSYAPATRAQRQRGGTMRFSPTHRKCMSPSPCTQGEGRGGGRTQTASRILIFSLVLLLSACGYQQSDSDSGWHWGSVYRQDIHSVAVPVFSSRDFHRNVEFQLSDALAKKIEEYTPYKVEPRERADTVLEGEIVAITPSSLSLNPFTATPQEARILHHRQFHLEGPSDGQDSRFATEFRAGHHLFPQSGRGTVCRLAERRRTPRPGDRKRDGRPLVAGFRTAGMSVFTV